MKIAAWNLNNRVGKVPFRLEAAAAAIAVGADIFVFNEYYPQSHGQAFQAELESAGWVYQALSVQTDEKANQILIASKIPIAQLPLTMPDFDQQFQFAQITVRNSQAAPSWLGPLCMAFATFCFNLAGPCKTATSRVLMESSETNA